MIALFDFFSLPQLAATWLVQLLHFSVKASLLLAFAGLLAGGLRRASAATRHTIWLLAVVGVLAMPLLAGMLPSWEVAVLPPEPAPPALVSPAPPAPAAAGEAAVSPAAPAPEAWSPPGAPDAGSEERLAVLLRRLDWTSWAVIVWVVGVLYLLLRLAVALAGVWWLGRRSAEVQDAEWLDLLRDLRWRLDVARPVRLLRTPWTTVPMTGGFLHPMILLPVDADGWSDERREVVLLHELAHIRRWDCLTQLLVQVAGAVNWFNPLVWVAIRRLRDERERACDDCVLENGARASVYAGHLLDIARSLRSAEWSSIAAVAMARRSQLEGRLLAILDPGVRRETLDRARGSLLAVAIALVMVPVAALRPLERSAAMDRAEQAGAAEPVRVRVEAFVAAPRPAIASAPEAVASAERAVLAVGSLAPIEPTPAGVNWDAILADTLSIQTLIQLRMYGVDAEYVRALRELGLDRLTARDLIELAKFGVDPDFIRSMREAGYTELDADELVELSKFGVDPEFVREMRQAGYADLEVDELVELSKFGTDAEFIRALGANGLRDLSVDDLVELRKFGVEGEYVAEMRRAGFGDLSAGSLIELRKFGVSPGFMEEMAALGYRDLEMEELVELAKFGVDAEYVRELGEGGLADLSAEELVELRKFGVDADFVGEMRRAGLRTLTVEELVELRKHGLSADYIRTMRESVQDQ